MSPLALAGVAFAIVNVAWLHYLALIPRERVPKRPWVHLAAMLGGGAAGLVGLVQGPGWLGIGLAVSAVMLAALFIWLLSVAPLPSPEIRVHVGEALPAFSARLPDGTTWSSDALAGHRTLLKVFRGSW